jgi:hypothetical protein
VAPIDFARRQSGAVNQYDIIPRQDLGGWTETGKTTGYAAIPLRMYRLPLNKGIGPHSYVVGSGSIDTAARFIEQTRWTTMPVIFDEADRYSEWEKDREARRILSLLKNSTILTNPRDTLTSDSEQITKPSAAYVMLTHNSPLVLEDGFSRRCVGHEFTIDDAKPEAKQKEFNEFWQSDQNSHTFGYLGDFNINYYLDHPEVLNNKHTDISKTLLRSFWVDAAGYTEQDFESEWDKWLGGVVDSATNKDVLIESRKASVVSMFRQMINDGWSRNKQQLVVWIAKNKRSGVYSAKELDEETGKLREVLDDISANASLEEKLEALLGTGSLTFLVSHPTHGIAMDSSIIKETRDRYRINRISLKGLAGLLGFGYGPVRFEDGVRKGVYAPLDQFVKTIAMKGAEEKGGI